MKQLLKNPDIQPTDEVVAEAMGESFGAWRLLNEKLTESKISVEWRYYNDGKAWLAKGVFGKKTVFWGSVWSGFFRITLYFTEKTSAGIHEPDISGDIKSAVENAKPIGKLIPLMFDVHGEGQLPDLLKVIEYKRSIK